MQPWDIIGWLLLGVGGLFVALVLLAVSLRSAGSAAGAFTRWRAYRKTRNVKPSKGQVWDQGGFRLEILNVYDNGRIGIQSGSYGSSASWSDTPEEWANRVRNRRLFLVRSAS